MLILLFVLIFCYFFRICARRGVEILFEQPGKIVDGTKAQHVCGLADRILALPDQLLAFLELDVEQIIFGRGIQMSFEQRLKRGARDVKLMAYFLDSDRLGDPFVHIRKDF